MTIFKPSPEFLGGWDWRFEVQKPGWSKLTDGAKSLQAQIGTGGVFKDYVGRAKALLREFDFREFVASVESRSMIRAFFHAWASEPSLAESTLRIRAIEAIVASSAGISRLGTMALIQLHLMYFDRVDQWEPGLFHALENAIGKAVSAQKRQDKFSDVVETVRQRPELVISSSAATTASKLIVSGEHTVEGLLSDLSLSGFEARRYRQILNHEVFLRRIDAADPHGTNDFLSQLSSDSVRKAPREGGGFFGVALLEALISRPERTPSVDWLNAILDIAGDPRLTHTQNWTVWWQPLSPENRSIVVRWLSDQDLDLFLRIIEEYAKKSGNSELQRMYPDRQQFLRGLQRGGFVRETRLYMPENPRQFARRSLPTQLGHTISLLEGTPDQSVIYIDCGEFHIVEGSHNFKIWIHSGQAHPILTDRRRLRTNINQLRKDVPLFYEQKGRKTKGISHNGIWQYSALDFMRRDLNVEIQPSTMMTASTYQQMRERKGMPGAPVRRSWWD